MHAAPTNRVYLVAGPAVVLAALVFPATAHAAATTFVVDTKNDTLDTVPGDGNCADATGACSLRAAIQEANANPGWDTIEVPWVISSAGPYTLSRSGIEDGALAGDLDITESVTVVGTSPHEGSRPEIVAQDDRVFDIFDPTGHAVEVEIENLELRSTVASLARPSHGGLIRAENFYLAVERCALRTAQANEGGGIYYDGIFLLELQESLFQNETADLGGAIAMFGTELRAWDTSFLNNNASTDGGAVFMSDVSTAYFTGNRFEHNTAEINGGAVFATGPRSQVQVHDTRYTHNTAVQGGGVYVHDLAFLEIAADFTGNTASLDGGGLWVGDTALAEIATSEFADNGSVGRGGGFYAATSYVDVRQSTLAENFADDGGGLYIYGGDLHMENATVSDNEVTRNGGGMVVAHADGVIESSTIAHNRADLGGGIYLLGDRQVDLRGSILGRNWTRMSLGTPPTTANQCYTGGAGSAAVKSNGYNWVTTTIGCNYVPDSRDRAGGAMVSYVINLDPLDYYGGPTRVRPPSPGTWAIDNGHPSCTTTAGTTLTQDQHGRPRPSGPRCDVGAYEVGP